MAVKLEVSEGIKRVLQVSVPKADIDSAMDKKVQEAAGQVRLPGFRPGKVPLQVVRQQFGESIRGEVISKAIETAYGKVIVDYKLKPAGMPKVTVDESSIKGDLSFKIELEVFPEFEVKGLADLEVVRIKAEITDKDEEAMLETLRKQHTEWKRSDEDIKDGDRLMIDFEGFKGGEAFAEGNAKDFRIIIGSKMMIPGFEDALIGKKEGTEFDINLSFPKDYHVKDLAGAPVLFKIKVKEVESPKLPAINDEFAKLFQLDSLDALKKEVRANMERELDFSLKAQVKAQVIEGLRQHNAVELPSALVHEEAERLSKAATERMKSWGQTNSTVLPIDLFKEEAEKRVALGLIMNRIIEQHQLKVDPARVKAMVEKMASIYESPEEMAKIFFQHKERMAEIEQVVLEEQVVDEVLALAKVKEETKNFADVMGQNANATANILPQG